MITRSPSPSNRDPLAPPPTLTVSQLNRQVRGLLEGHFDFVWIEGEISNFAAPSSGHWYFSLKDGSAQVRCAMFRNRNQRVKVRPGNGDAVRMRCRVSLYEGRGEFQLIGEFLEPAGAGALQAAYEKLKGALADEGLFDPARKQALPTAVSRLGVITSPTGAAIHDILTVLRRRWPAMEVYILPVAVQGEAAAGQIATAIANANRWQQQGKQQFDALIVGRGGGSLEDLWAFNEEVVARAIAASAIPIVSAVGHEVDFSIADLVADHRAATPSAAAELLSPDQQQWQQRLQALEGQLQRQIEQKLALAGAELGHLRRRLKHPGHQLREQAQRLDSLEQRLIFAQKSRIQCGQSELDRLAGRLQMQSPQHRLRELGIQTGQLSHRLNEAINRKLQNAASQLSHLGMLLDSLSPLRTLDRGYAIVADDQGKVITQAAAVKVGDKLEARLASGRLGLMVKEVLEEN